MALEHLDLTIKEWQGLDAGGLVLPPHLMPQPSPQAGQPEQAQQQQQQQGSPATGGKVEDTRAPPMQPQLPLKVG